MTIHFVNNNFDPGVFAGASCAFGVFDGMHRGHRFLIDQAIAMAAEGGVGEEGENAEIASGIAESHSVAITFERDPDELFNPGSLRKLMTNGERLTAINESGVTDVVVLPSTPELFSLEPATFLERLFGQVSPAHLHVGEDFRFGLRARGTVDDLQRWGSDVGCIVHAHKLVYSGNRPITATRIRMALNAGDIAEAERLLGHLQV